MSFRNWYLEVPRTARVVLSGEPGPQIKHVWLVFHGYRQLATNFMKKFTPIMDEATLIIAPEGLSRFYVDGVTGLVGASWMTREERISEIEDQFKYLNLLWEQVTVDIPVSAHVHILGFSQGVATAWRWLMQHTLKPHSFINWAGNIPQEFSNDFTQRLLEVKMITLIGTQDEFISMEAFDVAFSAWQEQFPHLEKMVFEGKHQVLPDPLNRLLTKLYGSM